MGAVSAVTADCAVITGREEDLLAQEARLADLCVVPHPDAAKEEVNITDTLHAVLFDSGRPVLVVPYAGNHDTTGSRVLVGWKPSREAARGGRWQAAHRRCISMR